MRGPVGREGKHHFVGVSARGSTRWCHLFPSACGKARCAAAVVLPHVQRGKAHGTHHDRRATMAAATGHVLPSFAAFGDVAGLPRAEAADGCRPASFVGVRQGTINRTSGWHALWVGDSLPRGTRASFFLCVHRMHPVHMKNGRTAARWAVTESSVRNAGGLDRTYLTALAQTLLRGSSHLCWNARAYLFHSPAPFSSVSCARDVCECRSCCRYVCA